MKKSEAIELKNKISNFEVTAYYKSQELFGIGIFSHFYMLYIKGEEKICSGTKTFKYGKTVKDLMVVPFGKPHFAYFVGGALDGKTILSKNELSDGYYARKQLKPLSVYYSDIKPIEYLCDHANVYVLVKQNDKYYYILKELIDNEK